MVGSGADDSDVDAISLVPPCETIDDVDSFSGVQIVDSTLSIDFPYLSNQSAQIRNEARDSGAGSDKR